MGRCEKQMCLAVTDNNSCLIASLYICIQNKTVINYSENILTTPIEFLKGVGPIRGDLLKKDLNIYTFEDLLGHFPFRHIDKTKVNSIADIHTDTDFIQVIGRLTHLEAIGEGRGRRLVGQLQDGTGVLELAWFQSINWVEKNLVLGSRYLVYGRTGVFNNKPQMVHPEMELFVPAQQGAKNFLEPVYPSTEKLKARNLGGRQLAALTKQLFTQLKQSDIPENIPNEVLASLRLMPRYEAYLKIHFPISPEEYERALNRLKFEEFFIAQVRLSLIRLQRHKSSLGVLFE